MESRNTRIEKDSAPVVKQEPSVSSVAASDMPDPITRNCVPIAATEYQTNDYEYFIQNCDLETNYVGTAVSYFVHPMIALPQVEAIGSISDKDLSKSGKLLFIKEFLSMFKYPSRQRTAEVALVCSNQVTETVLKQMIKGRGYHTESLQLRGFVDSAFGLVASSPDSTSKKEIARSNNGESIDLIMVVDCGISVEEALPREHVNNTLHKKKTVYLNCIDSPETKLHNYCAINPGTLSPFDHLSKAGSNVLETVFKRTSRRNPPDMVTSWNSSVAKDVAKWSLQQPESEHYRFTFCDSAQWMIKYYFTFRASPLPEARYLTRPRSSPPTLVGPSSSSRSNMSKPNPPRPNPPRPNPPRSNPPRPNPPRPNPPRPNPPRLNPPRTSPPNNVHVARPSRPNSSKSTYPPVARHSPSSSRSDRFPSPPPPTAEGNANFIPLGVKSSQLAPSHSYVSTIPAPPEQPLGSKRRRSDDFIEGIKRPKTNATTEVRMTTVTAPPTSIATAIPVTPAVPSPSSRDPRLRHQATSLATVRSEPRQEQPGAGVSVQGGQVETVEPMEIARVKQPGTLVNPEPTPTSTAAPSAVPSHIANGSAPEEDDYTKTLQNALKKFQSDIQNMLL